MKIFKYTVLFLFITALAWAVTPAPTGHVNDFANLLSKDQKTALETKLHQYQQDTSVEIAVVTTTSLEGKTIEEWTVALATAWGVGNKGKDNGILIAVAPKERKCRIETGKGIEDAVPDVLAGRIIQNTMIPYFKENKYGDGIVAGAEAVIQTVDKFNKKGQADPVQATKTKNNPVPLVVYLILGIAGLVGIMSYLSYKKEEEKEEWLRRSYTPSYIPPPHPRHRTTDTGPGSISRTQSRKPNHSAPPKKQDGDIISNVLTAAAVATVLSNNDDDDHRSSDDSWSSSSSDSDSGSDFGGGDFGGGGASGSW